MVEHAATPGIVAREQLLADDETARVAGLPVTTPVRTAYDLGRYLPRRQAVARLDALMRATPFSTEDVLLLAERYPAARGIRRLRSVLHLVDGGAASPKETWLRLLLIDAGLPTLTTQIPVVDRYRVLAMLDITIRVIAEDTAEDVIERVRRALLARGWRPERTATFPWAG